MSIAPTGLTLETPLLELLLREQFTLEGTAVEQFSKMHESQVIQGLYKNLIPIRKPTSGEQYSFEVDLDKCTGCKACVVACHSQNGLEENETWRTAGVVRARKSGFARSLQTITSACHHCVEPGCADGCPVLAYEKDPETGIVRHLDDQCMGCSYCMFKCPYDVPKYSKRLGIVRKCDMCQGRLAAGEAPACVQACPGGAITIRLVDKQAVPRAGNIVAGAFESSYTGPTTRYVSQCGVSVDLEADDEATRPLDDPHYPLVVMLVFTQAAAGGFVAACFFDGHLRVLSTILCFVGLIASFLHLGQPLKAVRAVLGWRKSWLSREIIVLSLFAKLAVVSFLFPQITPIAAVVGLLGVFASIMVYVDTKRPRWAMQHTGVEFGVTTVVAGLGIAALPLGWPFAFAAGIIGFVFGNRLCLLQSFTAFFPPLSLALGLGACLVQRTHFFTHARGGKMPAN